MARKNISFSNSGVPKLNLSGQFEETCGSKLKENDTLKTGSYSFP